MPVVLRFKQPGRIDQYRSTLTASTLPKERPLGIVSCIAFESYITGVRYSDSLLADA